MALTSIIIIKQSVIQNMKKQYSVTWELKGFDGTEELFSQTFNEDYKTGDAPTRVEEGFIKQMQNYINKYKSERDILNHTLMDAAVVNVQSMLEV